MEPNEKILIEIQSGEDWLARFNHPLPAVTALDSTRQFVRAELGLEWLRDTSIDPKVPPQTLDKACQRARAELATLEINRLARPPFSGRRIAKWSWLPLAGAAAVVFLVGKGMFAPGSFAPDDAEGLYADPLPPGPMERLFSQDRHAFLDLEADISDLERTSVSGSGRPAKSDPFEELNDDIEDLSEEIEAMDKVG